MMATARHPEATIAATPPTNAEQDRAAPRPSLAGPQDGRRQYSASAPKAIARTTAPDASSGICEVSRTVSA